MRPRKRNTANINFYLDPSNQKGFFTLLSLFLVLVLLGSMFVLYEKVLVKSVTVNGASVDGAGSENQSLGHAYQSILDNTKSSIEKSQKILLDRENDLLEAAKNAQK
ncbi:MAG: hypothetical protein A2Z88_08230 [Omnitrophica WOR_2 bacterium GWA2_47_8]|nr:MAG: hypothetical protein A2Z88_08230 [Omnitrophica WOR_2 bacterium GWA2_47_8]